MKSFSGQLLLLVCLVSLTGCVAVPPLISVEHEDGGAKSRIESLERRVEALEEKVYAQ